MGKLIKQIILTFLCVLILPITSFAVTWPGIYYTHPTNGCYELGYAGTTQDVAFGAVPVIDFTAPGFWSFPKVNFIPSGSRPVTYTYFYQRPSGDTSIPAWAARMNVETSNLSTILQNSIGVYTNPNCALECTPEELAAFTGDALNDCPLYLGDIVCVNGNPSLQCKMCEDLSPIEMDFVKNRWGTLNCPGGANNLESYSCSVTTHNGVCKDVTCNELMTNCVSKCGGQVQSGWVCNDTTGTVNQPNGECLCTGETRIDSPTSNLPIYTYDELTGQTLIDGVPVSTPISSPDATLNNLATINDNLSKQTNTLNNSFSTVNNSVSNVNTSVNNVNSTISNVNNSIKNMESGLGSKLDQISDKLSPTGTYNPESITNDFSYSDNATGQFKSRFTSFVSDLKQTPLFSLPNQVLFSIPDSTESIYALDMGSYGQFDVDFANYSTPLLILRSCFLICFSYAGLRIVVSKK